MNEPDSTRRHFLARTSLAGLSLTTLGANSEARGSFLAVPRPAHGADPLDEALELLHARVPDASVHRSNHVPMAMEALGVLGRPEAIRPWFEASVEEYEAPSGPRSAIEASRWRDALARSERFPDWHAFFLRELESTDWKEVVRTWAARLAPGLAGSATHGVIRTGHAARSVLAKDNAIRRRELATGLAYWASTYQELPWDGSLAPETSVEAALRKVQARRPALEPPRGNIVAGLRSLEETPSFQPVAGLIETSDPLETLHEITVAFARLFLRNPERQIAFTHAITAPSSLRLLLPLLDEETARAATRFAWQAAAGLYVVYGDPRRPEAELHVTKSVEELVTGAIGSGDPHAVKLTETCLREDAIAPEPVYRATAQAIVEAMAG